VSENSAVTKSDQAEARTRDTRSFMQSVRTATRRRFTPEEKIRIVLEGFRRESTVTDLCRREGINPANYYSWTKDPSAGSGRDLWRPARRGSPGTPSETPHE
jgi:transposase-like protein